MKKKFLELIIVLLFYQVCVGTPRVSIITSVFSGDLFIEEFMKNITGQTIFEQCELIMVNANSPGHEEEVIKKYMKKFSNITYIKLLKDPGLYRVWNLAINLSNAPYVMNANLDDRIKANTLEVFAKALDENLSIDLVYSDIYLSGSPNSTVENPSAYAYSRYSEFSKEAMIVCMPMNHPMWRKSMHAKYGFFSEKYSSAADYEMWLRAVDKGAQFLKIEGIYGLFYNNPNGLSIRNMQDHNAQVAEILDQYKHMFHLSDLNANQVFEKHQNASGQSYYFY